MPAVITNTPLPPSFPAGDSGFCFRWPWPEFLPHGNLSPIRRNRQIRSFFLIVQLYPACGSIPPLWRGAERAAACQRDNDGPAKNHLRGGIHLARQATRSAAPVEQRKQSTRRSKGERRVTGGPVPVERRMGERREKVNRRRQIDPTTCERDYTDAEIEFMHALDQIPARAVGRPTCSEVLEVLRDLGYVKQNTPRTTQPVTSEAAAPEMRRRARRAALSPASELLRAVLLAKYDPRRSLPVSSSRLSAP